jgi:hypothetical protein
MTRIFASSSRTALALGLTLALAGGASALAAGAHRTAASAPTSVRCFFAANADSKHGPENGGWICLPEHHSASVR